MGTRGLIGFTVDGEDKLVYNHFDSYPDGLGQLMVDFVYGTVSKDVEHYAALARNLVDVKGTKPTEKQKKALSEFTDLGVASQNDNDWYCLLRGTQYDPEAILKARYYKSANDFINDSLFCEYAYVINFDTGMLEMYEGFQNQPHDKGRFSSSDNREGYYPCALKAEYPFNAIPPNWAKVFEAEE